MSDQSRLAPLILKELRDSNRPVPVAVLVDKLGDFAHSRPTRTSRSETVNNQFAEIAIVETLSRLEETGLVKLERSGRGFFKQKKIRAASVVPGFVKLQKLVGFSLTDASRTDRIPMAPSFGSAAHIDVDVFVIMPFAPEFDTVYEIIQRCCQEMKLKVIRGDDIFGSNEVIKDIWSCIFHAKAIIADCSGKNANVFYELGIAHTVGRASTILLARKEEDIPFDLRHRRFILYSQQKLSENSGAALAEPLSKAMEKLNLDKLRAYKFDGKARA